MSERFVDITAEDSDLASGRGVSRRWLAGPPRWLFGLIAAGNAVLTMMACSAPGFYFLAMIATVSVWVVLALVFIIRFGLALALGGCWREMRAAWLRWIAVPVLVVLTGALAVAEAPMRANLELAKPAMREYAENPGPTGPARAGLYVIEQAEPLPGGGARFILQGTGFLDATGFVYSPSGSPPRIGEDYYRHLGGPWYAWAGSW
jgi:hypothetical protein